MARFSVCGGDDGEGPSNQRSRKRQRLPSIDEDEEDAEGSDAGSSSEEDEEETQNLFRDEDYCQGRIVESDNPESSSDDSDVELVGVATRFVTSVNSLNSSSKDSPLSVTLLDPDVLDCPICCEPLKIPVFQCDNGHLACSLCCTKVRNRCPSCTLPIGYIRCRAMEKVIETSRVPCPNAMYGCKDNPSYGNRFSHEKLCVFTPCCCPLLNCNYTGYYKDLNNHARDKHKTSLIPFVWNTRLTISLDLAEKMTILQEKNDGEVIVVQGFRDSHGVYVSVSCIAPLAPGAGEFSCSLGILTADSVLRQGLMVKNIHKVRDEQPKDGFLLIPSYMFSGNGNLDLQVCIGHGRTFVHT